MNKGEEEFLEYRVGETELPEPNLGWNMYGTGLESMGRNGGPEPIDVQEVGSDQLLIRIDAVGLCFSDVKLIRLGNDHPKLYGRNLAEDPTRLGHEAAVTVIEVGSNLRSKFRKGDRLAIQPDIHVDGRSTAYGYTIPGGLIQYHLIGPEVLDADDGAYVIPVDDEISYAAAALSEPWACVEAAYTQRRRLHPLAGGKTWIIGHPDDQTKYDFGDCLAEVGTVVLTDLSAEAQERVVLSLGNATSSEPPYLTESDRGAQPDAEDFPDAEIRIDTEIRSYAEIHSDYGIGNRGEVVADTEIRSDAENRSDAVVRSDPEVHSDSENRSDTGVRSETETFVGGEDVNFGLVGGEVETVAGQEIIVADGVVPSDYGAFASEMTDGVGFDDIIILDPRSAHQVTEAARQIAFRGTLNLVGQTPLDGLPQIDFGRLHYDYTAYVGTKGPDVSAAYGHARNRCDLRPGGTAVFIGAGGPMGQMHVQRALESNNGPATIIAVDPDSSRLAVLEVAMRPLAEAANRELVLFSPKAPEETAGELVARLTDDQGADDVVVTVPIASVMADAAKLMHPDGMLVFFAGIANGTMGPLDMSRVYLHNAQYTGTSGSSISDQALVLEKAMNGSLSPSLNLAAIGGIEAARDGVEAVMEGRFAGKVMIFPQVSGVPLLGLDELAKELPKVGAALGERGEWTPQAEQVLFENHRTTT